MKELLYEIAALFFFWGFIMLISGVFYSTVATVGVEAACMGGIAWMITSVLFAVVIYVVNKATETMDAIKEATKNVQ